MDRCGVTRGWGGERAGLTGERRSTGRRCVSGRAGRGCASGRNGHHEPPRPARFRPPAVSGRNGHHEPPRPARFRPPDLHGKQQRPALAPTRDPALPQLPGPGPAHHARPHSRPQLASSRLAEGERPATLPACPSPTASHQRSADARSASARPCAAASRRAASARAGPADPSTAPAAGPHPAPMRTEREPSHLDSGAIRRSVTRRLHSSSASRSPADSKPTSEST